MLLTLFKPNFGPNGLFWPIFRSRPPLAAHKINSKIHLWKHNLQEMVFIIETHICIANFRENASKLGNLFQIPSKLGPSGGSKSLMRPYCSTKILVLGQCCSGLLVLLMLLMLTLPTLCSAQRYGALCTTTPHLPSDSAPTWWLRTKLWLQCGCILPMTLMSIAM